MINLSNEGVTVRDVLRARMEGITIWGPATPLVTERGDSYYAKARRCSTRDRYVAADEASRASAGSPSQETILSLSRSHRSTDTPVGPPDKLADPVGGVGGG